MGARRHLRIARGTTDVRRTETMYCAGLGLQVLFRFENHEGFDGVMLGSPGADYHFEFTHCRTHPIAPATTPEDLVVFYVPDPEEHFTVCENMIAAGFRRTASFNPYWDAHGATFQDADGYRVVVAKAAWSNSVTPSGSQDDAAAAPLSDAT